MHLWICCVYLRQIVHLKHIIGDSCVGKSCYEWYLHVGYIPRKSVSCCIYLSSLIQTNRTVSPVTTSYTGGILFGKTSPTNSLIAKNVFDGAKRRLITYIEKKEPITPDMLLKLYNAVFKENNLMSQRIISSCLLAFAEFLRVFIPKSKTDIYRDGNTVVISRMDSNLYAVNKFRK